MPDVHVPIPAETRDRLTAAAAAEGLSLRAHLMRLAGDSARPARDGTRADRVRQALHAWNGYDPDPEEEARLDAELDRRIAEAAATG
ncbi:hypothetical protein J7W19_13690 [Streptomyces mobaraensis NBRC 13819 = DSM 40847]|uniref:Arc-like DNA binding domain-containing protein n=1 Tax=Streptomyces mobaraensis (strain ATCC 29032 / DSM 40847 / JCM 4168 / NBRC 13819 / NCIMB 11159 / IPCR 16-22) TaxID=1223523 RepID=M3AVR1_STRM1|nr:hypothetical protein [Streptomyces mobaraensis]EME97682.1 hypothetical protein H340_25247 [Streptomyces mobaraensis NBRC 13819 = DSM 40847]QTT74315.1 hypothetical protein J7W19_13690 [Streptomyces mobaraensis NBRC 13819 = DSM 40847]